MVNVLVKLDRNGSDLDRRKNVNLTSCRSVRLESYMYYPSLYTDAVAVNLTKQVSEKRTQNERWNYK